MRTIGEVAKEVAVNVQTLRYYERIGLLKSNARTETGYRLYEDVSVKKLKFIKHAQELGFTLKEIEGLLTLGSDSCSDVKQLTESKIHQIEEKIEALKIIKSALKSLATLCNNELHECPIIHAIEMEKK